MIVLKLRSDIEKAMSSGKVTLSIFADYFKAFHANDFDFFFFLRKIRHVIFPSNGGIPLAYFFDFIFQVFVVFRNVLFWFFQLCEQF